MTSISDIRDMLPDMGGYAYFQTSGFSPKPIPVIDEIIHWLRFQSRGPALPFVGDKIQKVFEKTRSRVAGALNASPEEIVLGENATVGINIVANGIEWKEGDNVILSSHEHPGNRLTWYNIADRHHVKLRFVKMTNDRNRMLNELRQMVDDRTRLISISHVSRRTGMRVPAAAICEIAHNQDVPVLFDGAQSFGAIPVDVRELDCDFYAFCGHKYILAPQGTGGLYIRQDRIEWVKPSWIGSHSQKTFDQDGNMMLLDEAKRFEFGTRNLPDQAGFGKALDIWNEIGWKNVFQGIAQYSDHVKKALQQIPDLVLETPLAYEESSGIVTFHVPGYDSITVLDSLRDHEKVLGSSLEFSQESVRISTHVFNTDEHLARLVSGIRRIMGEGKGNSK